MKRTSLTPAQAIMVSLISWGLWVIAFIFRQESNMIAESVDNSNIIFQLAFGFIALYTIIHAFAMPYYIYKLIKGEKLWKHYHV